MQEPLQPALPAERAVSPVKVGATLRHYFEACGLSLEGIGDIDPDRVSPPPIPPEAPTEAEEEAFVPVPASPRSKERELEPKPARSVPEGIRYSVRIQELPLSERPRERLINHGASVLSTSELIAILLRTGTSQRSAVSLAEQLLATFGGLRGVAGATIEELGVVPGVGAAKATQIKAAFECGRRLVAISPLERLRIHTPQDIYDLLGPGLREEKREHFIAVLLDTKGGVIRQEVVSIGDLSSSIVHPREVFREVIRHGAAALIVAHNHPSGDPTPSPEDAAVTRRLARAGELLGIELLDHIILGDGKWLSLKEKGIL